MSLWKDHEKLSLLSELIKLSDTQLLSYLTQCLSQRSVSRSKVKYSGHYFPSCNSVDITDLSPCLGFCSYLKFC